MFRLNLNFKEKIYFISFVLVLFFALWSFVSYKMTQRISDTMTHLSKTNDSIQNTLVMFGDLEKLKRYIFEYSISADESYLKPIEELFGSFEKIDLERDAIAQEHIYTYEKLLENIEKYRLNFQIVKEQAPVSFSLRIELREEAQRLENLVSELKENTRYNNDIFKLILFRKSILEIEKATIRYLETDSVTYVSKTAQELKIAQKIIQELQESGYFFRGEQRIAITNSLQSFKKLVYRTIEHYRTYSLLTRVIMAGNTDEIYYYSTKLSALTLEERKRVREEIEHYTQLNKTINFLIGTLFVLLVFGSLFLVVSITLRPLSKLTKMFEELSQAKEDVEIPEYGHDDEIGKLIEAATQYKRVNKKTKELLKKTQEYQENLESKVQEEIAMRREREKALIQQSKLASMGEMIGAIAHQWRQPLNELSIRIQKLKYAFMNEKIDEAYVTAFIEKNKATIDFMSHTIDDFRNFFRIDKEKKTFGVKALVEEVLNIQAAQLKNHNIEVELEGEESYVQGFKTEFQQVLINIISNSKDAFVANSIASPKIRISVTQNSLYFLDNGGGIDEKILDRVFEPYFTTKDQGEGTGMGLYMSKMIIEDNMRGKLEMTNKEDGILVTITLPKES